MKRAFVAAMTLTLTACAPLLTITHRDPTHRGVDVVLDQRPVARLEPGTRVQVRVARGAHALELKDGATGQSPWADDGQAVELLVDGDVDVTLSAPATR